MIQVKRAYAATSNGDRVRALVGRLWPRDIKKRRLEVEDWLKDVAPSPDLRRSFNHDPKQWNEFRRRCFIELEQDLIAQ